MNLWDKKLGLLVLVALSFFACEEEIGLTNVTPENNLGIFFAEYPLDGKVNQLWAGSSPSTFSGRTLAGVMEDSIFGKIKSTAYFDYLVSSFDYDTISIETAEVISAELKFRITDAYGEYKDTDVQSFEIYSTGYIEGTDVKTSSSSEGLKEKIGDLSFNLLRDSVDLNTSVYGGDTSLYDAGDFDSNGNYIYTKSINLESSFIDYLNNQFQEGISRGRKNPNDPNDTDSIFYFVRQKLDEGFAMIPNENNTAIVLFNILSSASYDFILNYNVTNAVGTTITKQLEFVFSGYNNITPNELSAWNGGFFNGITTTNKAIPNSSDYLFNQSGTNMLIEVDLSDFQNLEDTIPNSVIQRAVLSISNPIQLSKHSTIPSRIGVYLTNDEEKSTGDLNNIIDVNVLKDLPNNANLDTTSNVYSVEIPLYLQSLMDRKITYDKLILGLDSKTTDTKVGSDEGFTQFGVKKDDIKLTLYYSVTN